MEECYFYSVFLLFELQRICSSNGFESTPLHEKTRQFE